jgi:elongation factor Ts
MITAEQVKILREKTNVSVMECRRALEDAEGDIEKALENLKGAEKKMAGKKSEREMKCGIVEAYVHNNGKIGVLLELACETDFVARNEEFHELEHNLAMHIAAMNSNEDDLLLQPYVKNPDKTVEDLINGAIGKLGENIQVKKFVRYEI